MDDSQFSRGPARRPVEVTGEPVLQWATGLQTRQRSIYAGWLSEQGRNEDFDAAMATAEFPTVVIKHGTGNYVTHWAIETANLFVIADGVQSISEMKHTDERYGIAFGWRTLENGRQQSQLRFRAHLQELLELGFDMPVVVTAKSTITGDLLAALTKQYDVLDAIDTLRAKDGKPPMQPPFYACALPIGPGEEVARGSGGQTKEITPPEAKIPTPITKEYVLAHWLQRGWLPFVENRVDQAIRWSCQVSAQIASGDDGQRENYAAREL